MSAASEISPVYGKLSRAANSLKTRGVGATFKAVYTNLRLQLEIRLRGQSRKVTLDGCTIDLRGLPNTRMKLQLQTGSYEFPERSAARKYIDKDWPVIELGGCIGVVACVTNKLLQHPSAHIVLEANPLVIKDLAFNRDANDCSFTILNRAIAHDSTFVMLTPSPDFWGTSLYDSGSNQLKVEVPTAWLGDIVRDFSLNTFALICDIEGQEYPLVMNELTTLSRAQLIIMEVHPHTLGEDKVTEIISKLSGVGFAILERMASVVVFSKQA